MKKHLIAALLSAALLCSTAFAVVGGQEDPLISKSYITNSYPSVVLNECISALKDSMTVLRYKLSLVPTQSGTVKPFAVDAKAGDSISVSSGASFTMLSGSLSLKECSGTLLDVSTGTTVKTGQALSSGHRYVAAEDSSLKLYSASSSKLGALGGVSLLAAEKPRFNDVSETEWFYSDVYYAVEKGLINGRSSTTYDPNGSITYAEAIKLAACMHQLYSTGSITLQNAAAPEPWYSSYVEYAQENGIISGSVSDYDAKISRAQFVAIFYKSMPSSQYTQKNTVADNAIPDVKTSDSYAKEIYAFYRAGILIGSDGAGTFYPGSSIKRSEVAAVVTRMYEADARKEINL